VRRCAIGFAILAASVTTTARAEEIPDLPKVAPMIVHGTNALRQQDGQRPLTTNVPLTDAARYFAEFLSRSEHHSHTADGQQPAQRARQYGYDHCILSENIAFQFNSEGFRTEQLADDFVQGWERSPGHRKNMHHPDVTDIGVAVARNTTTGHYYGVQMFGLPRSAMIAFEIANRSEHEVRYSFGGGAFQLPPSSTRSHRVCGSVAMEIHLPDAADAIAVTPRNGARYTLDDDGAGKIRLETK
jgi:uncharacterized protein YkwD